MSLTCPLECEYLQAAHRRGTTLPVAPDDISYREVIVTEEFVRDHEEFLLFSIYALVQASLRHSNVFDTDVMAALAALIRTHQTQESGLFYESVAENAVALGVQRSFSHSLADYGKLREEREGLYAPKNSEILAILVFLHRIGQANQNGRPRGRMFLDLLRHMTPDGGVEPAGSSIIV